ncbi:unnamed protein product [Ectocarpus sp. CCAP 1310/34]|nr:unnamed protein product [Ectocarpus sp. CCAP 1310/34]
MLLAYCLDYNRLSGMSSMQQCTVDDLLSKNEEDLAHGLLDVYEQHLADE